MVGDSVGLRTEETGFSVFFFVQFAFANPHVKALRSFARLIREGKKKKTVLFY